MRKNNSDAETKGLMEKWSNSENGGYT